MNDNRCAICQDDCDGKLVIIDNYIQHVDGKDMIVCPICFNLWTNQEFDELTLRIRV